jgi:hypothetical protein
MALMLHRRDGTVAVKCRECQRLCEVPGSSSGDAVCGKCVRAEHTFVFDGDRDAARRTMQLIVADAKRLLAQGRMA